MPAHKFLNPCKIYLQEEVSFVNLAGRHIPQTSGSIQRSQDLHLSHPTVGLLVNGHGPVCMAKSRPIHADSYSSLRHSPTYCSANKWSAVQVIQSRSIVWSPTSTEYVTIWFSQTSNRRILDSSNLWEVTKGILDGATALWFTETATSSDYFF